MSNVIQIKQDANGTVAKEAIKELEENFRANGLSEHYISVYDCATTPKKLLQNDTGGFEVSVYEKKAITWDYDKETDTYRLMHIIKYFGPAEVTGRKCVKISLTPLTDLDKECATEVSQNLPYFVEKLMEIAKEA